MTQRCATVVLSHFSLVTQQRRGLRNHVNLILKYFFGRDEVQSVAISTRPREGSPARLPTGESIVAHLSSKLCWARTACVICSLLVTTWTLCFSALCHGTWVVQQLGGLFPGSPARGHMPFATQCYSKPDSTQLFSCCNPHLCGVLANSSSYCVLRSTPPAMARRLWGCNMCTLPQAFQSPPGFCSKSWRGLSSGATLGVEDLGAAACTSVRSCYW